MKYTNQVTFKMNKQITFSIALAFVLVVSIVSVSAGILNFTTEAKTNFKKDITISQDKISKIDSSLICQEIEKKNKIKTKCKKIKKDILNQGDIIKKGYYNGKEMYIISND